MSNLRLDLTITRKNINKMLDYFRASGYKVTEELSDDKTIVTYKADIDWNFGVIAESIKGPTGLWTHFFMLRIPKKDSISAKN